MSYTFYSKGLVKSLCDEFSSMEENVRNILDFLEIVSPKQKKAVEEFFEVVKVHSARREEGHLREGSAERFERLDAAVHPRGEKFYDREPVGERAHYLGRRDAAGIVGHAFVAAELRHFVRKPGGDDEPRSRPHGAARLIGVDDRARAYVHVGEGFDADLDRLFGAGGAESDLRAVYAAGSEGGESRLGVRGVFDDNDGDDALHITPRCTPRTRRPRV